MFGFPINCENIGFSIYHGCPECVCVSFKRGNHSWLHLEWRVFVWAMPFFFRRLDFTVFCCCCFLNRFRNQIALNVREYCRKSCHTMYVDSVTCAVCMSVWAWWAIHIYPFRLKYVKANPFIVQRPPNGQSSMGKKTFINMKRVLCEFIPGNFRCCWYFYHHRTTTTQIGFATQKKTLHWNIFDELSAFKFVFIQWIASFEICFCSCVE